MAVRKSKNAHRGVMFGIPLVKLLTLTNLLYMGSLLLTFILTVTLWRVTSAVQAESDAQLERYKAQAASEIAKANTAAEIANTKAIEANERTKVTELTLESTKLEVARANTQVATLQLEIARIKAPRALDKVALDALASAIQWLPTTYYTMAADGDEREVKDLLSQLLSVFDIAGWKQEDWRGAGGSSLVAKDRPVIGIVPSSGIIISIHPDAPEPTQQTAYGLKNALNNAQLECQMEITNAVYPKGILQIIVGRKPVPKE